MNRLGEADSSYLRRAADEPIDWYPWGDEAFDRAKAEDKPVLLSIGAVWCHWCHVMARETWHDRSTAAIINERFIPVKVDRDDRPDIDRTYQEAVQALTGNGGWPLTVFLTPDKQPFYGGTYFPDRPRHGLPAFRDVLTAIADLYTNDRGSVERIVNDLTQRFPFVSPLRQPVDPAYLEEVVKQMRSAHDTVSGGFGSSPKFPYSEALLFLLQYYESTGDRTAWEIVDNTLSHMAAGGVYDQVGGGFHRYSVDAGWKVPHFEKMLNDNALLLNAYLGAYQLSGNQYYRQVASEIVEFVFRDLRREPAGFASSIDADVHHEEGAYFVWEEQEIRDVLGDRADAFIKAYNVTRGGNFEPTKNVLYPTGETDKAQFAKEKKALLQARDKREKPYVDMSIHTSWTALMITSLARAYSVLGERRCLDYAVESASFIMDHMYRDGTLYRTYTDKPVYSGYLEDYSCMIEALLELYVVTQEAGWLDQAEKLLDDCEAKFFDREHGGYFFVQAEDRTPMMQDKPVTDFSVPGSNPQMAMNLIKLSNYRDKLEYMDRALALVEGFFDLCRQYPLGHGTYFAALDYYANPPEMVAIVGPEKEGRELVDLVNGRLIKKIVMLDHGQYRQRPAVFEGRKAENGRPTAYFCKDRKCILPLTDREDILEMLKRPRFGGDTNSGSS
ncbi:thioredoxin domain-containing protein [Methanocella arvoryzae]|nr:thioredoxin domain-containing protein [Methanocella arvoryzae]